MCIDKHDDLMYIMLSQQTLQNLKVHIEIDLINDRSDHQNLDYLIRGFSFPFWNF